MLGGWVGGENVGAGENDLVKGRMNDSDETAENIVLKVSCLHLYGALSYFLPLLYMVGNKKCSLSYIYNVSFYRLT